MNHHPNETPEPLAVVAWRKHLSGAEWKVADYVLLDSEELVRLSDATAALQAKDAEIAGLKADAVRERIKVLDEVSQALKGAIRTGNLQGSGWDDTAQRNGLIIAANMVVAIRVQAGGENG